jgi:phosphoesterase RecJ-like protein
MYSKQGAEEGLKKGGRALREEETATGRAGGAAPLEEELGGAAAGKLVRAMAERLRAARGVLLTAHVFPDGDALGSELALALGLERLKKRVRVVNSDPAPEKYRFLDPRGKIEVVSAKRGVDLSDVDLGVLLDTSEPSRAGLLEKSFFGEGLERMCLDHHPGPNSPLFRHHWVAEGAAATGVMVLRLLDALEVEIDPPIATALWVAIATDTGWFRFPNTTAATLRDAARLRAAGADPDDLHRRIYEESSLERLLLLGKLLSGLRSELGGRFVWSLLERRLLDEVGVGYQELDGFSEALKAARGAEVVALVVETEPGSFKVSLRARGEVAVNAIAGEFGGGGHRRAAGFRAAGDSREILARLRSKVESALARLPSR